MLFLCGCDGVLIRVECGQFFDLLCTLVKESAAAAAAGATTVEETAATSTKALEPVLRELVERLLFHPYVEQRNSEKVDQLLVGVLQLLTALVETNPDQFQVIAEDVASRLLAASDGRSDAVSDSDTAVAAAGAVAPASAPRGLVTELFYNCLFARPPVGASAMEDTAPSPPRCKTERSRKAAYGLLTALCHNCPRNLNTLFQYGLVPLEKQFTKVCAHQAGARACVCVCLCKPCDGCVPLPCTTGRGMEPAAVVHSTRPVRICGAQEPGQRVLPQLHHAAAVHDPRHTTGHPQRRGHL